MRLVLSDAGSVLFIVQRFRYLDGSYLLARELAFLVTTSVFLGVRDVWQKEQGVNQLQDGRRLASLKMRKIPTIIRKLAIHHFFDSSPAKALKSVEDVRKLPIPTLLRNIPLHKQPDWSGSFSPDPIHGEPSLTQASVKYEAEADEINRPYSLPGSPQDGGLNVSSRRWSNAKGSAPVLNLSSQDDSNRDMYNNGDCSESSDSLFDIEIDKDEKGMMNPQSIGVVNRRESEVEVFSQGASSGSFSFEHFLTAISPSQSSRTSTSDKLIGYVTNEQSWSETYSGQASDPDVEEDVELMRRSSLAKEDLERYCSELMVEHMDKLLLYIMANVEALKFSVCDNQVIGSQPHEGLGHLIEVVADRLSKGNGPFWEVSEENVTLCWETRFKVQTAARIAS